MLPDEEIVRGILGGIVRRSTFSGGNAHRETIAVISSEDTKSQTDVLEVVHAFDALRFGFSLGQSGKQHTSENSDDGDND